MPSRGQGKDREIQELTKWVKEEFRGAKREQREVILVGDFNGVSNPRIDRRTNTRNSNTPELDLLSWIQTETLHDAFRTMYPLKQDYTCQDVSRIDMIFLDNLLVGRLIKVKHITVNGISSDHRMVSITLTTQGLLQAPNNPQKYKKPRGFRFKFREADKSQWEAFAGAMYHELDDPDKLKELGIKGIDPEDETIELENLQNLKVEEAWR
ncbi:hypothetical protein BGX27_004578, partial [Mortierella sp. AM989]